MSFVRLPQNAKGPAATGIAPDQGSTSHRDAKMNEATNTTAEPAAPDAMELESPIADAERMASILSRLVTDALGGRPRDPGMYHLTKAQCEDILFAAYHTEDLIRRIFKKLEALA